MQVLLREGPYNAHRVDGVLSLDVSDDFSVFLPKLAERLLVASAHPDEPPPGSVVLDDDGVSWQSSKAKLWRSGLLGLAGDRRTWIELCERQDDPLTVLHYAKAPETASEPLQSHEQQTPASCDCLSVQPDSEAR